MSIADYLAQRERRLKERRRWQWVRERCRQWGKGPDEVLSRIIATLPNSRRRALHFEHGTGLSRAERAHGCGVNEAEYGWILDDAYREIAHQLIGESTKPGPR